MNDLLAFRREELAIEKKILDKYLFPKNEVQREIANNSRKLIEMIEKEIEEIKNAS